MQQFFVQNDNDEEGRLDTVVINSVRDKFLDTHSTKIIIYGTQYDINLSNNWQPGKLNVVVVSIDFTLPHLAGN